MHLASVRDRAIQDAVMLAIQELMRDEASSAQRIAFQMGVSAAELEVGGEGLFDPDAQRFIQEFEFRAIDSFTADFADRVHDEVLQGIRAGEREEDIARRLRDASNRSEARLRTIARTETNRAANHGRLSSWKKMGTVDAKEAIATNDDRVRATHMEADGEVVPVGGTFTRGAAAGLEAPPWEPNCRCTIAPVNAFTSELGFRSAVKQGIPGLLRVEDEHTARMVAIFQTWPTRLMREATDGVL